MRNVCILRTLVRRCGIVQASRMRDVCNLRALVRRCGIVQASRMRDVCSISAHVLLNPGKLSLPVGCADVPFAVLFWTS